MSAVHLARELVLEQPVRLEDGAGGFVESWAMLGRLWAEVTPGTGREAAGEERYEAWTAFRITVRGAPAGSTRRPRPGQRFRDGQRLFRILAVTERDPAGHYLACAAREEVPA